MHYKDLQVNTVNNGESLLIFTFISGNYCSEDNSHFDLSSLNGIKSQRPV